MTVSKKFVVANTTHIVRQMEVFYMSCITYIGMIDWSRLDPEVCHIMDGVS